jgi:hypothetical protein
MTATKVRVLDAAIDLVGTEGLRALTHLFEFTTGVNRTLTTARLVLFMEASHNAALRDALTRGRAAMEATALACVGPARRA